ncbi:MAG: hypothetical protein ABFR82_09910 [Nitrospirota bacterium]
MNCNDIRNIINSMLYALCSLLLLLVAGNADGGTYLDSAHGDSTSGVNRSAVTGMPYPDTSSYPTGHCGHCHEQHTSIGGTEPSPVGDAQNSYSLFKENLGTDTNELCYACHETFSFGPGLGYGRQGIYQGKTKFNNSIHFLDSKMSWSPDPVPPGPPYNDTGNCHNCHNPHGYNDGSGLVPNILFARDSKTGDSPAYEMGCEACHDGTQAGILKDIKTQLNKTYAHPTHTYSDRHTLPETGQSESGSSFGPANRHAECVDCHNPHALGSLGDIHTAPGNAVSDVIKNVWGVEPTWPTIWTQPILFTVRKPSAYPDGAQYEYQICFKCHSYYGLGSVTDGVSSITGPSGISITDQAWEFNNNNKSVHPVVVSLNNQTGSTTPKPLTSAQMSSPWNSGTGNNTMYCSDCHGADDESSGAKGPHGSTRKFLLKGNAQYWPTKSDGSTLWKLSDYSIFSSNGLFCINCHPIYDGTWKNNVHSVGMGMASPHQDLTCVTCHVAVPHGSKRSRLIGYGTTDPSPYNYAGNSLKVTGFRKASGPNSYVGLPATSTSNNCATAGTSGCHGSSITSPEP